MSYIPLFPLKHYSYRCVYVGVNQRGQNISYPSPYSFPLLAMSSSSLGSRSAPWLGEGLNMPPQSWPILHSPLPDRVTPVYVKAGNMQELLVHMCLQADGNVAFEDTSYPGFGICRSACHDSSLYIFVLVTLREAVVVCVYVSHV